jgi:RNA polymerase sigma factor CnrH
MDYDEIGELIGKIKFHYIETGQWNTNDCEQLLKLTRHVPIIAGKKRGVRTDDLYDIVQQTYQEAFKNLAVLIDDRAFPKYLFTIADNLCRKYWLKRYKFGINKTIEYLDTNQTKNLSLQTNARLHDNRENLRDAVSQLPEIYRETIEMHYFAGMKSIEIADTMDISINTVTSRIRRARKLLKTILEDA